jgi:hypothetical protein
MALEPIDIALLVTSKLESLDVRYAISGSLAGTIHGCNHTPSNVDIVADLQPKHVISSIERLGASFYVSTEAINRALEEQSLFVFFHADDCFQVAIFLATDKPFENQLLSRCEQFAVSFAPYRYAYLITPEDLILIKLELYQRGVHTPERQWQDVIDIIKFQGRCLLLNDSRL